MAVALRGFPVMSDAKKQVLVQQQGGKGNLRPHTTPPQAGKAPKHPCTAKNARTVPY